MVKTSLKNIKISNMNRMLIIISFFSQLFPCAVCYGDPNHPVTHGMNNAIIFLLFTIVFVLSCIIGSILVLVKRAKAVELKRSLNDR
tara:strand:- start:625 stop:885 length:261 start_codon:yes stop_codon:yes gene_type:complete